MDCYTKSITVPVSIRSGSSQSGITLKNIKIPIIKPMMHMRRPPSVSSSSSRRRPAVPLCDVSNQSNNNERLFDYHSFSESMMSTSSTSSSSIATSPRTQQHDAGDEYAIERTASATRLYLIEGEEDCRYIMNNHPSLLSAAQEQQRGGPRSDSNVLLFDEGIVIREDERPPKFQKLE